MPQVRGAGRQRLPHPVGQSRREYHTARFILVPALREELAVAVPADRGPSWQRVQGRPTRTDEACCK